MQFLQRLFVLFIPFSCALGGNLTVKCDRSTDLKSIFDSGLRPTQVKGFERDDCEVKNLTLIFNVPGARELTMKIDEVRFTIDADNNVTKIFAESPNLPLKDAYKLASDLMSAIGVPPKDLKARIESADAQRSYEPLRDMGVRLDGSPETRVYFVPGDFVPADPHKLYVRVSIAIYWLDRIHHGRLRTTPIAAPSGYESISMQPLPPTRSHKAQQGAAASP